VSNFNSVIGSVVSGWSCCKAIFVNSSCFIPSSVAVLSKLPIPSSVPISFGVYSSSGSTNVCSSALGSINDLTNASLILENLPFFSSSGFSSVSTFPSDINLPKILGFLSNNPS
jgi:hypothetical protein